MNVVHPTRFEKSMNLIGNMMQLQICCVLLSVVSVLAQYRHQWPHSYGPSSASYIISHKIPAIEEFKRGWMGFYEYRPIFSRILFGSIPDSAEMWKPAGGENIYKGRDKPAAHLLPVYTPPSMVPDVGESEGFQNWKQELFGPSKQMELQQQRFPSGNSDSHELEEIVSDNINVGAQDDDSIHIKDDINTTSVANVDNKNEGIDSEEKEENNHSMEEPENPDKNVVLDDDGKSEYPATSPELVELNPEKITSGEVSEDVAEPEVSIKGPSDPEPAEIHWNPWKSVFDYPSNEKRPATDFFHSNNRQQSSSEDPADPVKFATQDPFSKWWNSAEEFSVFSDDDTPAGVSESSEAIADPKPSISPVPSTTPEPIYKFVNQPVSDGPKSIYKHNYRKVTIDKNKRPQTQTA